MYVSLKVLGSGFGAGSGCFGPPGSGSISQRYGSGSGSDSDTLSFPFLTKVLSGLKDCLQNKILTQNLSKQLNF
jgi:hypothetical protein